MVETRGKMIWSKVGKRAERSSKDQVALGLEESREFTQYCNRVDNMF
jgi:hypothetical protein